MPQLPWRRQQGLPDKTGETCRHNCHRGPAVDFVIPTPRRLLWLCYLRARRQQRQWMGNNAACLAKCYISLGVPKMTDLILHHPLQDVAVLPSCLRTCFSRRCRQAAAARHFCRDGKQQRLLQTRHMVFFETTLDLPLGILQHPLQYLLPDFAQDCRMDVLLHQAQPMMMLRDVLRILCCGRRTLHLQERQVQSPIIFRPCHASTGSNTSLEIHGGAGAGRAQDRASPPRGNWRAPGHQPPLPLFFLIPSCASVKLWLATRFWPASRFGPCHSIGQAL